ncbi:MAG: RDD family protein [Candidatus Omnitrophota bacterium]
MRFEGLFLNENRNPVRWWFEADSKELLLAHLREKKWRIARLSRVEFGKRSAEAIPADMAGLLPAGFLRRYAAYILDQLIFAVFLVPLTYWNMLALKNAGIAVLLGAPLLIYKPLMEAFFGATLGKMALGVRVIDPYGDRLTLEKAFARFIPFLVVTIFSMISNVLYVSNPDFRDIRTLDALLDYQGAMTFDWATALAQLAGLFLTIDCLMAAFNGRKRALHDHFADSYCIRSPGRIVRRAEAPSGPASETKGTSRITLKPPEER